MNTPSERKRARRGETTTPVHLAEEHLTFILPLRKSYVGDQIQLFETGKPRSQLTGEAKKQILEDYHELDKERLKEDLETKDAEIEALKKQNQALKKGRGKRTSIKVGPPKGKNKPVGRPSGVAATIAEHYGVSKTTVTRALKEAKSRPSVSPLNRPGRNRQGTPTQRELRGAVRRVHNEHKGRITQKRMTKKLQGAVQWSTSRKGKEYDHPSAATLSRLLNDGTWEKRMVRKRPNLDERAIEERKKFAPEALARDDCMTACHDEAYSCVQYENESLLVDMRARMDARDEDEEDEDKDKAVRYDAGKTKGNEPKVFLFGCVTEPKTTIDGGGFYHVDPQFNGKILLARIRGHRKRKGGKKQNGQFVLGDTIWENITMDGKRYKEVCEMDNGLWDSLIQYYKPEKRLADYSTARVLSVDLDREKRLEGQPPFRKNLPPQPIEYYSQEDGAPGHGYNNRANKETEIHAALVHNALTLGIKLVKQSRHSPEFNMLDLGVWHSLKRAVEARALEVPEWKGHNSSEVEACIWKIIKEEWDKLDPIKLFFISKQRRELLQLAVQLEGKSIVNEPHFGLRKRFRFAKEEDESSVS